MCIIIFSQIITPWLWREEVGLRSSSVKLETWFLWHDDCYEAVGVLLSWGVNGPKLLYVLTCTYVCVYLCLVVNGEAVFHQQEAHF